VAFHGVTFPPSFTIVCPSLALQNNVDLKNIFGKINLNCHEKKLWTFRFQDLFSQERKFLFHGSKVPGSDWSAVAWKFSLQRTNVLGSEKSGFHGGQDDVVGAKFADFLSVTHNIL